jgi:hypothetical protein
MGKKLILIHGRSQENKDSEELKLEWIGAWEKGLKACGLERPVADSDICFPYYGDALYKAAYPSKTDGVKSRGDLNDKEVEFIGDVLGEVARHEGIDVAEIPVEGDESVKDRGPGNWALTLATARAIDQQAGFATSLAIMTMARDVHKYMQRSDVQLVVDKIVDAAFATDDDLVVVGHSLGSVVQKHCATLGRKVPLFVTLGSPLGISRIRKLLSPVKHPPCAATWFNARDDRDGVALFPLAPPHFKVSPSIENHSQVKNWTDNKHGIVGYLDDPVVARRIFDALIQ